MIIKRLSYIFVFIIFILLPINSIFAGSQTPTYQTNCFSAYTTNPDNGKLKTINMIGSDGLTKTINFIDGPLPYPLLDNINLSAPTSSLPPCEDRQDLGYNAANTGYNAAYIVTSDGDIQLGYPKNVYGKAANYVSYFDSGEYNIQDYTNSQYYLYTGFKLTPPFAFNSKNISEQITDENKIVRSISKDKKLNIRIGSSIDYYFGNDPSVPSYADTHQIYPVTATIPATNCVHMSGTGPKSIVFMRDMTWHSNIADFLDLAQNTAKIILKTSPYNEYASKLSFYVDLSDGLYDSMNEIRTESSCGNDNFVYILINNSYPGKWFVPTTTIDPRSDSQIVNSVVFLTAPYGYYGTSFTINSDFDSMRKDVFKNKFDSRDSFAYVAIHELAHSIGYINDEYEKGEESIAANLNDMYTNCSPDPSSSFSDGIYLYGSMIQVGCTNKYTKDLRPLYRPTDNSLMRHSGVSPAGENYDIKFNVVTCGYLVSALLGQPPFYDNAKTHFAECEKMDTVKDGYVKITSKPNIFGFGLKTTVATPGSTISITSK